MTLFERVLQGWADIIFPMPKDGPMLTQEMVECAVDPYQAECRAYIAERAKHCTPDMIAFMEAELEIIRQGGDPERVGVSSSDQLPWSMTPAECDERAFWFDQKGVCQ